MAWTKEYGRQHYLENKEKLRQQGKEYYSKNKERIDARNKKYYASHRNECCERGKIYAVQKRKELQNEVFRIYGHMCACCGESNQIFLTLDHINGNGTRERTESPGFGMLKKAIREADKTKYQILCYNCNCGRWRNKGICPHKSSH